MIIYIYMYIYNYIHMYIFDIYIIQTIICICIYIHMYIILYYILRTILITFECSPRRFRSISPPTAWLTWTTVRPLDQTPKTPNWIRSFPGFWQRLKVAILQLLLSPGSTEDFWVDTQIFIWSWDKGIFSRDIPLHRSEK